jgi:adenylate cyclase
VPERSTFLFADLVGFTALTEQLGDDEAADLALRFCDDVCALNRDHGGEDVKTLGDGALIRVADPAQAVCLAVDIVTDVGARNGIPDVRVGAHHGTAVHRRGDWFGSAVNTAARVAAAAAPGQALVTRELAAAAGAVGRVALEPLGEKRLRGIARPVAVLVAMRDGDASASPPPG